MAVIYQTILMDPPWNERGGGKSKRGADRHYALTKTRDMPSLIKGMPEWSPDPARCSVWCWATIGHLPDAIWLLGELGAPYVTHWIWNKPSVGIGQRLRGKHELLLLGTIGRVPVPAPTFRYASVFDAQRPKIPGTNKSRHSAKPVFAYGIIEHHDGRTNRMELFARSGRDGWSSSGDQLKKEEASS